MPRQPSHSIHGFLVTFEGTEGAGKSTLIREVASLLTQELGSARAVTCTREPGGSPVAESIRSLILHTQMNPWTELFLYQAARAEHLDQVLLPALKRGDVVLCDRFTDSTLAYQGQGRGLPWREIETLNCIATQGIQPGLTVFLDIDPAIGLERANEKNRFEEEGVKFQTQVRRGFLKARSQAPKRWLTLKVGSATPEFLAAQVIRTLLPRLKKLRSLK